MRKAIRNPFIILVLVGLTSVGVVYGIYRYYWHMRTTAALQPLSSDGKSLLLAGRAPADRTLVLNFNTAEDETIDQHAIRCVFDQSVNVVSACTRTAPEYILRSDEEGWDCLCAVWNLPDGYAELSIGSGNDNDHVYLMIGPGQAPPRYANKPGTHRMAKTIFAR
jgi:hypothetical protein